LFNGGLKIYDMSREWKQILGIFFNEVSRLAWYFIKPTAQLTTKVSLVFTFPVCLCGVCYNILETLPFSFLHSYDSFDYCHMCSTMGLNYSQANQLCTQLSVVFPVDQ
jgi:hypothetical protein